MMYRLLVLCAILAYAEPYRRRWGSHQPCHGSRCPGTTRSNLESLLEPIERDLIEQEERFLQFCRENSPAIIGEQYGTDYYYLTYDLPEARNSKITVRIKHKFLLTTVTKTGEIIFQDVKVLPDIANTENAQWTYENGQTLKITIPYNVPIGEATAKTCGVVNNHVIDVPCTQSCGSNYDPQDSSQNGDDDAQDTRSTQFTYRSQDSSQNGYNKPGRRFGSSYRPQDSSENGYNMPARRSGYNYGSQDSSENGYNMPARHPGSSYRPQDSSENGDDMPARRSGFNYRSQDSSEIR